MIRETQMNTVKKEDGIKYENTEDLSTGDWMNSLGVFPSTPRMSEKSIESQAVAK
jgi:hypothetical protein